MALASLLLQVGCGGAGELNAATPESSASGVRVPGGFSAVDLISGLRGPTQMAMAPDGRLLVAELAGSERAGTGRVIAFPAEVLTRGVDDDAGVVDVELAEVLFDDLVKPTGLAVVGDRVWVMEERSLSHGPLDGGVLMTVLEDLPYNGRSQGTLTATPDGRLLYNTSGSISGGTVAEGSGVLWSLEPGAEPQPFATGFKHAYARTFDSEGRLWQTEMSDGSYDGQAALDELVLVREGDDFGWPRCVDNGRVVEQYGGTDEMCDATPRSSALFESGATPTAVAVAPWDPETLLVALWNRAIVMSVPLDPSAIQPADGAPFLRGLEHPQDLLVTGDRLLVADHETGRIVAVFGRPS